MRLLFALLFVSLSHCGYQMGHKTRQLPGGHKTVYIQTFKNLSEDVGAEAAFTRALMAELERSGFAVVTSKDSAELMITGEIISSQVRGGGSEPGFTNTTYSRSGSTNTSTSTNYNASFFTIFHLEATANMRAVRLRDQQVLWRTNLKNRRTYRGSRLKKQGVRSSNVLYNHNLRKQTMKLIAEDMMSEAFDRLTENF